ncbi:MAG: NADH dehydrogenase (quinone) subunit D [Rudaea sp.]
MAAAAPVAPPPVRSDSSAVDKIRERFGSAVLDVLDFRGQITITVAPASVPDVARFVRDNLKFEELVDVTCLDWLIHGKNAPVEYAETIQGGETRDLIETRPRFDVLYSFLSLSKKERLRLRAQVGERSPNLPTVTGVYPGANFYEREVFDLFGINFVGHPFMQRILMPDYWVGYPLRKDHPLGYETVEYTHTIADIEATKPKNIPPPTQNVSYWSVDDRATAIPVTGGLTALPLPADDETHESLMINMGPHHPSTHGVLRLALQVDGERIASLLPDIGYLHTGIEKNMEYKTYFKAIPLTDRMDYLSTLINNLGYCMAVEKLMDVDVPERAQIIRVIMSELTRIQSHLIAVGSMALDLGAVTVFTYAFREREAVMDLYEMVSGARMMTSYIRIGGVALEVPRGFSEAIRAFLKMLPPRLDEYEGLLDKNPIWLERTRGVGEYDAATALSLGVTGPLLRATGVDWDLRKRMPYCGFETYDFEVPLGTRGKGDMYTLYRLRVEEMRQSLRIVEQAIDRLDKTPGPVITNNRKVAPPPKAELQQSMESLIHHFKLWTEGFKPPIGFVYSAVESPRGEIGFLLSSDGSNKPHRVHVRTPSFCNLQLLPVIARGRFLSDLVGLIGIIDPVLGDVDR